MFCCVIAFSHIATFIAGASSTFLDGETNGDTDAAAAMTRVTGLSLVDNQFVFVRGLGERYSNTTMGGSVIPTTEPDKKVVPLDLFPTSLIDSVQIAKSYSADKSAEFADDVFHYYRHQGREIGA